MGGNYKSLYSSDHMYNLWYINVSSKVLATHGNPWVPMAVPDWPVGRIKALAVYEQ